MFHYTVESEKTIQEAISSLEKTLKDDGFGVLWQFNMQEKLKEKGVEFDSVFNVLEVCNPHEAKRVMEQNNLAGYFLPCKMVVYAEGNVTKIGMPKPTALIHLVADDHLSAFASDIENRLIECINKAR
ncbi:DUF302 domain-containing protein [Bacillus sp. MUM 13]|uniref:DUF302 domain-containing protein n=1 Tax=Bacillus sp. MUM 13 TaxID=1678001 RepID=UPI0008F56573|nr:DUF302 domain-containing protein [Bacillus sp. MUM 13]OIK13359.1 hypothetical protein BIV59_06275 [Bacillus sp. MUM 13]